MFHLICNLRNEFEVIGNFESKSQVQNYFPLFCNIYNLTFCECEFGLKYLMEISVRTITIQNSMNENCSCNHHRWWCPKNRSIFFSSTFFFFVSWFRLVNWICISSFILCERKLFILFSFSYSCIRLFYRAKTKKETLVKTAWDQIIHIFSSIFAILFFENTMWNLLMFRCYICFFFQVSWVRRKGDELNLITFGLHTYSSDSRYSLEYIAPSDWQLMIQYANERDEGHYECQISR